MGKLVGLIMAMVIFGILSTAGYQKIFIYRARTELREVVQEITEAIKLTELTSELTGEKLGLKFSPHALQFNNGQQPLLLNKNISVLRSPKMSESFELKFRGTNWNSPATIVVKHKSGISCKLVMNRLGRINKDCSEANEHS